MELNKVIIQLLRQAGKRQGDLAKKLQKSPGWISEKITKGDVDEEMVDALSELVDLPKEKLWEVISESNFQKVKGTDIYKNKIKLLEEEITRLKAENEKLKSLELKVELQQDKISHLEDVISLKDKAIIEKERDIESKNKIIAQNELIIERISGKVKKIK